LLLAGCGAESPPPQGETIACAIAEGAEFAEVCTLEKVAGSAEVVIHHPDGSFRRLIADEVSGSLTARDSAEPLVIEARDGATNIVKIGGNRYRLDTKLACPGCPQ